MTLRFWLVPDFRCRNKADNPGTHYVSDVARLRGIEEGVTCRVRTTDLFYIAPGHDSWVVGNEPYVSLHFMGADHYAK